MGLIVRLVVLVISGYLFFHIGLYVGQRGSVQEVYCPELSELGSFVEIIEVECDEIEKNAVQEEINALRSANSKYTTPPIINTYLHTLPGTAKNGILLEAFSGLHHPDSPLSTETLIAHFEDIDDPDNPYQKCNQIYLTRTGSLQKMPNKCLAVVVVRDGAESPYKQTHRRGTQAKLVNMYQQDFLDNQALKQEQQLLPPILKKRNALIHAFREKMGPPVDEKGGRRSVVIMVANEGVLDLVLNFLCSCKAASVDIASNLIVFVGQEDLVPIIESMGISTFFDKALGPIPKKAADFYGDSTFKMLMWLKTTSIYLASAAGFNVLFQDVDLVWIKNPVPFLQQQIKDIAFMDDGARTPRFTPYFVNSGFYYQQYTPLTQYLMERMVKSIGELAVTHSHQATLTKQITDIHHVLNLEVSILRKESFPSGMMYHHNHSYIKLLKNHEIIPDVFHMCWTSSRNEKVAYFKDIGMWFLPEESQQTSRNRHCHNSVAIMQFLSEKVVSRRRSERIRQQQKEKSLLNTCCLSGNYWRHAEE